MQLSECVVENQTSAMDKIRRRPTRSWNSSIERDACGALCEEMLSVRKLRQRGKLRLDEESVGPRRDMSTNGDDC